MSHIFYHADCVDGGTACALFSFVFKNFEKVPISARYGPKDFDPTGHEVIFVDVMPPDLERYATASKLTVIDHHQSNLDAFLVNEKQKDFPNAHFLIRTDACAAKLVYKFLKLDKNPDINNEVLEKMIHYIDLQDRHVFDDSTVTMARGLNAIIKDSTEKEYPDKFLDIYTQLLEGKISFDTVEEYGKKFINDINSIAEQIISDPKERVLKITYNDIPGIAFSAKAGKEADNRSMIVTYILEKLNVDFGIAIEFHGMKRGITCTVRSKRSYDILKEMKKLGAKGHSTAAAFPMPGSYRDFNEVFKKV